MTEVNIPNHSEGDCDMNNPVDEKDPLALEEHENMAQKSPASKSGNKY